MSQFTHLHLHTEYSMLDGANKIKELAKEIKAHGMDSVAITDHGNMFGVIDFYTTMKKEGIKPIIGMEAYIHNLDNLGDKSTKQRFHLCLYAKNDIGYKNLMYLSSQAYINGFYYYPRINKKLLKEHSEGLICSSACLQGEINWHINTNNEKNIRNGAKGYDSAKEIALEYKEIFGDDFYMELMRHGIDDQYFIDEQVIRLSRETGIPIVATNDTHYLRADKADAHEAFMCIAMNKEFDDPQRLRHSVHEFYLKTPQQMKQLYADIPEAISNTQVIVNKCNLDIKLGDPTPPNFKFTQDYSKDIDSINLPSNDIYSLENDKLLFINKCQEGLETRLKIVPQHKHQEYRDRLEVEINIINNMKFPGYMLIVWDFVREAKIRDIPVGPGRGSAAGSLVAYALEITNIDPMKYDLLFERFLNPERISMPDIDMDFCQSRRGEIIDYVVKKYGRYNVAQIITFGSLKAKGVIRDVARVLAVPYAEADKMAKLIPDDLGIDLKESYEKEPKIKELIDSNPKAKRVWDFALSLEGLKRNAGTHAAGVVISNEELWNKTPLFKPTGIDTIATQYNGKYVEDVDLIKFDFLGLKTLTVIDNAKKLIKKLHNVDVDFDRADVDDPKIYNLIKSGATVGLFQIESDGMQKLNEKLAPSTFEDIIAVLALYRPGPMESGMLDDFIDRKHGRAKIDYFYDEFEKPLKPILEPTYGVIVYQEQVMQIVQVIGGFSLGGADLVRRAMGKKIKEEMDKLKAQFADGAVKNGYVREHAIELFDLIVKFAGYGFNKSHSAAYAMVTFQTSYLKAYYPSEFMAALLSSEQDNTDKIAKYIDELRRLNIDLVSPDINRSDLEFIAHSENGKNMVYFGMGAIKGTGNVAINSIIKEREQGGEFSDLSDFVGRIDSSKVNKRVIESLAKTGAFDKFEYSRRAILEQMDTILETSSKVKQAKEMAVNSLFGDSDEMTKIALVLEQRDEYTLKQILEIEKESLGIYVSGHPLDEFKEQFKDIKYTLSSELADIKDGTQALFIGKVENITSKVSKKGAKFGIINILDWHGDIELMLFADFLDKLEQMDLSKPIAFKTSITKDDQFTRTRVLEILTLDKARDVKLRSYKRVNKKEQFNTPKKENTIEAEPIEPLLIMFDIKSDPCILENIKDISTAHQGNKKVTFVLHDEYQDYHIQTTLYLDDIAVAKIREAQDIKVAI